MATDPFIPSAYQCCLLLLHVVARRDEERKTDATRLCLSELTLKRVCCRPRLDPGFLAELQDWMLRAGWALFYADRSYAAIKLDVVGGWPRLGSKRIRDDLDSVARGEFDFGSLDGLFKPSEQADED